MPSSWRSLIEDPSTLKIFLDFYAVTKPPLSSMSLECLVRLASVRRSLFTNETERSKFLNALVNGTRDILQSQMGLSSHTNYHEYCRLLGRLKTNYQLAELVRTPPRERPPFFALLPVIRSSNRCMTLWLMTLAGWCGQLHPVDRARGPVHDQLSQVLAMGEWKCVLPAWALVAARQLHALLERR